jgi:flagellar motor protein MotB
MLLYTAFAGVPLAAQYRGMSFGLGGEVNAVSLQDDRGYGAALAAENRLNRYFALAFLGNASLQNNSTLNDISEGTAFIGLEAALFLRFYFISPWFMQSGGVEMFLGAGGGVMAVMNGRDVRETRGHPEAAGIFGVRFRLGRRLYLEPYVRGGFPFIGGAGVAIGLRFPSDYDRIITVYEVERVIETAPHPNNSFVIIFAADSARFDTLDEAVILKNEETLSTVLQLLGAHPSARLLIEGYANPVLGTGEEEQEMLKPLSERRAEYIADTLVSRGVPPERLLKVGEGGNRVVVPWEDRDRWEQNRRVEIRFLL